eukprot:TRINITY_DN5683_c0_g1_i1.p1 TRINITY_DN5683_c0_g1~~TRINITY_DN5683_c0_g1_i1.p1  ORF type:complete len:238 (-),score=72.31 TRINITY_DN5683_c0_g1_i1:81-794(-)
MSIINYENWLNEFEKANRFADDIVSNLNDRLKSTKKLQDSIEPFKKKLSQFSLLLNSLNESLTNTQKQTNPKIESELSRRKDLLKNLTRRTEQINGLIVQAEQQSVGNIRASLISENKKKFGATGPADDEKTKNQDTRNLFEFQSQMMQNQDLDLDRLRLTIGRQKEIAQQIGSEIVLHNVILDEVSEKVDETSIKIAYENQRISTFSEENQTKSLWLLIIILLIVLIILIAMPSTI